MEIHDNKINSYSRILDKYLPTPAVRIISEWIIKYKIHLKIKRSRTTKLGDYKHPNHNYGHVITINNNLNKFGFLVTLVHEIAHLTCWEKHKNKVKSHGNEWKQEFQNLMDHFLYNEIFPDDLLKIIRKYLNKPAASSCTDQNLYRALISYNIKREGVVLLEELPRSSSFKVSSGRQFKKGEKLRKWYLCRDLSNNKTYRISPMAEVILMEN